MQMVILAGGMASRLGQLTENVPKAMLAIHGKPFLQYQIELLENQQVTDIILCVGHLSDQIESYFGDGDRFGVCIRYAREKDLLLGTGGALKNAEPLLDDCFFVQYGDSYLTMDYASIENEFRKSPRDGLMVVYRNENRYDRSNVAIQNGFITEYRNDNSTGLVYIDEGVSVLRKEFLETMPPNERFPLGDIFKRLIAEKRLRVHETDRRFYEIGSEAGLREFKTLMSRR